MSWDQFRAYGPSDNARFDHHDPASPKETNAWVADRAVWYGAIHAAAPPGQPDGHASPAVTAVAEKFQDTGVIDRLDGEPWLTLAASARAVRLLDLRSGWGARAGCGGLLGTGPKAVVRGWSRDIHAAYPEVDGVLWGSSVWAPGDAIVLYERARDVMPSHHSFSRPLASPDLYDQLATIAQELGGWPVI